MFSRTRHVTWLARVTKSTSQRQLIHHFNYDHGDHDQHTRSNGNNGNNNNNHVNNVHRDIHCDNGKSPTGFSFSFSYYLIFLSLLLTTTTSTTPITTMTTTVTPSSTQPHHRGRATGLEDEQREGLRWAVGGLKGLETRSRAPGTCFFKLYYLYFILIHYQRVGNPLRPYHHASTTTKGRKTLEVQGTG